MFVWWVVMVCGVLGLGGLGGGGFCGGGKPKGFLLLVTLEASSCREE